MSQRRPNKFCAMAILTLSLAPTSIWAFQISPCLRILTYKPGELSQEEINWFNRCEIYPQKTGLAVHEHLTNFSIEEYRGHGFISTQQVLSKSNAIIKQQRRYRELETDWYIRNPQRHHSTSDLIYGTWWNDDPLMLLWGEGTSLVMKSSAFGEFFTDASASFYPGGTEYCQKVPRNSSLGWNSHYGSLQHLHFMSETSKSDASTDRKSATIEKSLDWIKFAYEVATLKKPYNAKLSHEDLSKLRLPSLAENYCLKNDDKVTIRTLFSRVDFQDKRRKTMVPDVALGSILHIIQDSFSPAHTCRIEQTINGHQYAILTEVYNYNDQVNEPGGKDKHSKLDHYPQWLLDYSQAGVHKYENDPVKVGAWLIDAVDADKEWSEVRDHLLNTIFKVSSGEQKGAKCIGT